MIRILLADDDPGVRKGLRMRLELEPDIEIVGEAGNGLVAIEQARALGADVVLMDIRMPVVDGIAATQAICADSPHAAVVVVSLCDDPETKALATGAGACDFVCKHEATERLIGAIHQAAGR